MAGNCGEYLEVRFAAKVTRMRSQLDWLFLEIEEQEWNSLVGTAPQAAAGTLAQSAEQAELPAAAVPAFPSAESCTSSKRIGQVLVCATFFTLLALLVGCALWCSAQQGLARMEGDIAVAMKAEMLHQRLLVPARDEHESIEAIEFLSGKAMARVVVTQTLASGAVVVRRETRFFSQTPKGWLQTEPIAAFWGERQTLATPHLRFVFGAKDRAAIAELAPEAEAYYVALRQITDSLPRGPRPSSGDLLTVKFLPERVLGSGRVAPGLLELTSPLLYRPDLTQSRTDILAAILRQFLIQHMLGADGSLPPPKPQWAFMAAGMRNWLLTSDKLPLHANWDMPDAAATMPSIQSQSVRLADLSQAPACAPQPCSYLQTPPIFALEQVNMGGSPGSNPLSSWQEAATLLDFIATEYGLDAVGALVQGFARYDDWKSLVPATLGVSATELENGWRGLPTPDG